MIRHQPAGRRIAVAHPPAALALAVCLTLVAHAGADGPAPGESDGRRYPVTRIVLMYGSEHPGHPPLAPVTADVRIRLVRVSDGFIAASHDHPGEPMSIDDLNGRAPTALYGSAIQQLSRALVAHYGELGFIGINVGPHPDDIDGLANDLRPAERGELRLVVRIGVVSDLRTVAAGDRVPLDDRIDHPKHRRLVERSPVQPADADDPDDTHDLLRKNDIDRYVAWLNRHPGRRVDVAIAPGSAEGTVVMDYLVNETKPWAVYYQLSNTGTEQTTDWRHRFGFTHYQLTNNDDVLQLDYITSGFDEAHAVLGSYEAPVFDAERLRWKVHGYWSRFTASDVGFLDDDFDGESYGVGGDLIANIFQRGDLFVDLIVGARWDHEKVHNETLADPDGSDDFVLPHVALELERYTERATTYALVDFAFNLPGVAGTDEDDSAKLGRADPDVDFAVLSWSLVHAFYLEPLLNGEAFDDPDTPASSTLAHELAFMFRGQTSLGARLVPREEMTVGGGYTVRGYPESVSVGDNAYVVTIEYRFHVPRALPLEPDARVVLGDPFRFAPQHVYGRTDWDLILRAFLDWGRTEIADKRGGETDENLLGAGVGIEFAYRRNINIRVDWGVALRDVDGEVSAGSNRFHFVFTFLY